MACMIGLGLTLLILYTPSEDKKVILRNFQTDCLVSFISVPRSEFAVEGFLVLTEHILFACSVCI